MKFVYPEIDCVFDFNNGRFNTLVIENQDLFTKLLWDLHHQLQGDDGQGVLSEDDAPIPIARYGEVLDVFVPFELNRKTLLGRISAALEREALDESHYEQTVRVMQEIEILMEDIAFRFPCDLVFPKIGIASIIKATGLALRNEEKRIGETVIDYMELVTEFDRSKVFFTVNMRSFVSDAEMQLFAETVLSHGFQVLALESTEHPRLERETRWTIDEDLCEIG